MYTKEEVYKSTLEYFKGDQLATNVWISKYALKDKKGNILELNPDMMHKRLAKEVARIEKKYLNPMFEDEIYSLIKDFRYFVFAGSPAYGIGNNFLLSSLANCFLIGNGCDSYGGILYDDQELVQLMKRRGGVGHDLSYIRPNGSKILNSARSSSGVVTFAERFSNSTREVAQSGGRRGALLLSIHIKHPDSGDFISCKHDKNKITGANVSVRIDRGFMEAVKNDSDYYQTFPVDLHERDEILVPFIEEDLNGNIKYNKLYTLSNNCYAKKVKARELWNKIVHHATLDAEPGMLFWDTVIEESIASCYGDKWKEKSCNPCGEIPLNPYDSCRLSSLNLYSYVEDPFTDKVKFNWELFEEHCKIGQRIMDDFVDLEEEKINKILNKVKRDPEQGYIKQVELNLWEKIRKNLLDGRRTGFGITGEGDMLAALGYIYGTDEANDFTEEIHKTMAIEVYKSSIQLAKERGCFPIWDFEKEKENPFIKRFIHEELHIDDNFSMQDFFNYGRRNIACLTIAPNGTLSIMTQTTSGIEPAFEVYYNRRRKVKDGPIIDEVGDHWEEYKVFHHKFVEWFEVNYWNKIDDHLNIEFPLEWLEKCSDKILEGYIKESPYYKSTANTIDYFKKVEMQGRIQKWIDHSISVTHNLPKGISEEEVSKIYLKAYEVGCKGCTIYVDGTRSGVLIKDEKKEKRPESLPCDIYVVKVRGNDWVVLIGLDDRNNNRPYEVFAFKQGNLKITHDLPNAKLIKRELKGSNRYDLVANSHFILSDLASFFELGEEQSLTRQISLNLRYKIVPLEEIIDQLDKSVGSVVELSKAVSRVLKKYVKESKVDDICPECGADNLIREGGCIRCECGWSKC